jgi:hypothetical protein
VTTEDGILFNMYEVMDIIMPEDADRYFIHAGYFQLEYYTDVTVETDMLRYECQCGQ